MTTETETTNTNTISTNPVTLADVQAAMSTGARKLGALVYWAGLSEVRINRALFRQGFAFCGLDKVVSRDPKPEAILNTAASSAMRKQPRNDQTARVELKGKGADVATYGVLMRRDIADRRRYLEEAQITVMRYEENPTPTVQTDANAPADDNRDKVIAAVLAQYDEIRQFVHTQELSETLMRSMAAVGAISLRTGVYFVPEKALPTIRSLKAFVEGNTPATITMWDIAATDENAATARRDAHESFKFRLSELVAEVKTFTETCTPEDAASKSINARIRHFRDLDERVTLWADILGDFQADLHASIATAKETLLAAYLGEVDADSGDDEIAA